VFVGARVLVGVKVGLIVGRGEGRAVEGTGVGFLVNVGSTVGLAEVGKAVVGCIVLSPPGSAGVGTGDGPNVGLDGAGVAFAEGGGVGIMVGTPEGSFVGRGVGFNVGTGVGYKVGK